MSQEETQDLTQCQSEVENDLQDPQEDPEDDPECIATLEIKAAVDSEKVGEYNHTVFLF